MSRILYHEIALDGAKQELNALQLEKKTDTKPLGFEPETPYEQAIFFEFNKLRFSIVACDVVYPLLSNSLLDE